MARESYARLLWTQPEMREPVSLLDAQALADMLSDAVPGLGRVAIKVFQSWTDPRRIGISPAWAHNGPPRYVGFLDTPQGRAVMTVGVVIHEIAHFLAPPTRPRGKRRRVHHQAFQRAERRLLRLWRGK